MKILYVFLIFILLRTTPLSADWMPDPKLRRAVEKKLGITKVEIQDLQRLYDLVSIDEGIQNLKGLEHANNLNFLHIAPSHVSDITPLVNLPNLKVLKLYDNGLTDISSFTGPISLEVLELQSNQIVDISPLANLHNLRELYLHDNQIDDFTPIRNLPNIEKLSVRGNPGNISPLLDFGDEVLGFCNLSRLSITDRTEKRDYPSIFGAWHNIINLPTLSWDDRLAYHDLYWCCPMFGMGWQLVGDDKRLSGNLEAAKQQRDALLAQNPNMVFLVGIYYYGATPRHYPEDWPYWLRDESGNRVQDVGWGERLIDFTQPGAQDHFVQQAIEVAKCGVFDGIFLDWWSEEWNVLYNRETNERYRTLAAEVDAKVSMLRRIREAVGDDFLILVNTNRSKVPRSAPYINGTFMETLRDSDGGYTYAGLSEIEDTLLWSEENFREPQINSLEGWGIETQPLDSPANQRWMRVFTTMSLTHSDGYVSLATGISSTVHSHVYEIWDGHSEEHARGKGHDHQHQHYWYKFWDADLGRPVGAKGQLYKNIDGIFIREFTNGYAVYNRSGTPQAVRFNEKVSGVENGVTHTIHILSDLDGDIYLKVSSSADVNGDGSVNILDLVKVANAFGKRSPDLNGDGVVNILDLVMVANNF